MLTQILSSGTLLTSDNCTIDYLHYKNGHEKVIIVAHGFYNSKEAVLLKKLAESFLGEYDVFMFDFRGHGKSKGAFSWGSKEEKDLLAVLDYVGSKYKKIGLIAFSVGASISLNVLGIDQRVSSLVCVSAPIDINKVDYHFWQLDVKNDLIYTLISKQGRIGKGVRLGPFWLRKKRPIDSVEKIKASVFYIHGDRDWIIKPWHSRALYEKTSSFKKIWIVKNGPHAEYIMKDVSVQFIKEIKNWFSRTL
jgi:pimeloyl-ACP methyl ester carboxylesterase